MKSLFPAISKAPRWFCTRGIKVMPRAQRIGNVHGKSG
jgi:hypothetical protein